MEGSGEGEGRKGGGREMEEWRIDGRMEESWDLLH